MNQLLHYRHAVLTISVIGACIALLTRCVSNGPGNPSRPPDRTAFAGSEACANCHKDIYASHIHTAHYLTTRPATQETIKGSFQPGSNSFAYDSGMVITMEKTDSGFYQVGYYKGKRSIAKRFDIVVGSASKGQTYITRYQNRFYQLPVSYFTAAHEWANSPMFPTYPVVFNRSITSRCLECHTTFAHKTSLHNREPEEFDPDTFIYGVDCEKCHGPGARHVAFQSQHPAEKTAKFILNPASFTRQQTLDLCILCHGGRLKKTKPSFSFIAGDKLDDYFALDSTRPSIADMDVHGNQYGLLSASKCYLNSPTMTCLTCHNSHANERGNVVLFSQRCAACHSNGHGKICKLTDSIGPAINTNCIDCHMPLQASRSITELLPGDKIPTAAMIHTHLITIYPDQTAKFNMSKPLPHH